MRVELEVQRVIKTIIRERKTFDRNREMIEGFEAVFPERSEFGK